jgi:hypothetical protein
VRAPFVDVRSTSHIHTIACTTTVKRGRYVRQFAVSFSGGLFFGILRTTPNCVLTAVDIFAQEVLQMHSRKSSCPPKAGSIILARGWERTYFYRVVTRINDNDSKRTENDFFLVRPMKMLTQRYKFRNKSHTNYYTIVDRELISKRKTTTGAIKVRYSEDFGWSALIKITSKASRRLPISHPDSSGKKIRIEFKLDRGNFDIGPVNFYTEEHVFCNVILM